MTEIATTDGVRAEHVVVPLQGAEERVARLGFDNGLERVTLRAEEGMEELMEARFGEPLPVVWADGRNVHVEYPKGSRILRRVKPTVVRLNTTAPWALDVHGGAADLDADLSAIDTRSVTFHSGAVRIRLTLGRPELGRPELGRKDAPCTLRMTSVRNLVLRRPADIPVRLEIGGGATRISLDDRRYGAVGGGLTEWTPGKPSDGPYYSVVIAGSADTVTIEAAS